MQTIEIKTDFSQQRQEQLDIFLLVTVILSICLAGIRTNQQVLMLALVPVCGVAYILRRANYIKLASLVFLGSLLVVVSINLWETGATLHSMFLLLIPLLLSNLLLDIREVIGTAILTILLMFGITAQHTNFFTTLNLTFIPIVFCLMLIAVLINNLRNSSEVVYWATDLQQKDRQRAEMFYQQREQLSAAMLDLAQAKSKVELINSRLEEAQEHLERASRAKSIFMSNMSHELRTPLNAIIGYSSSILKMPKMFDNIPLPDIYRPYLQLIEDNGHYLVELINDILDLSKIESGKLELHRSAVELPSLFRSVIAISLGLIKEKPIQIRTDFPETLPLAWADPVRVKQILLNLMSNAIKFTSTGSVTLSADSDGSYLRISVSDTGIGIPEAAQAIIFDRFQQAERGTDRLYGGTGLGLDISKQLSLMHGGDLTVHSVVGQGSTFTFILPIAQDEQLNTQSSKPVDKDVEIFNSATSSVITHSILVVEDEVSTRNMFHQILESSGYASINTHNGYDALELASGFLPDLIILDVNLPDLNGWEVLKRLKDNPETAAIPVIICTVDEDVEVARTLGATRFLRKPVTAESIINCVASVLNGSV